MLRVGGLAIIPPVLLRRMLASFLGTGLIMRRVRGDDAGAGTVGSLAALVLGLALARLGWGAQALAALAVGAAGLWAVRPFTREGDPGWVVVDEAAGTLLAIVGLGVPAALAAFVVFRLADITKALPGVAAAERLVGAAGIMADDLVAGLYGLAVGWLVTAFI